MRKKGRRKEKRESQGKKNINIRKERSRNKEYPGRKKIYDKTNFTPVTETALCY